MPESAAQEFARLQRLTPKEAVEYLQRRGRLTQTFSWMDLWHDEHAQQFTVSRLARADLLKAMQEGITKSVQGDLSRADWTRDIRSLLKSSGWWGEVDVFDPVSGEVVSTKFDSARLKLIFDTNTRMANSAGLWERAWRNRESHPYVRYITRDDERVRESHRAWHNLVLPSDDPFWETHWPPNGYRCRCRVTSLTQREYDRGYSEFRPAYEYNPDGTVKRIPDVERIPFKKTAPAEALIEWTNRRTGEVSMVPAGVSPGFDYNPGLSHKRLDMLQQIGLRKLDDLPAPIRRAAMTPVVSEGVSAEFAQAVSQAYDQLPEGARKSIAAAGYEVKIVDRVINATPDLDAKKYAQVDGLTRFARREIFVAEQALDKLTNSWHAADGARGATVLTHEIGHALDEIHRLSAIPAVQAAWHKESAALATYLARADKGLADEIEYFTQPWPRGTLETVAELYALRHGTGTATFLKIEGAFPETRAALEQVLAEKGL